MLQEPRFTHVTLPVSDLVTSVEWYERYTPLRAIDRRRDPEQDVAWMCHPEPADHPFVLVLFSFDSDGAPERQLGPYGHLGIELPSREAVDAMAVLGRADGCLAAEPNDRPTPIGYASALHDPDGNVVEFTFDLGIHDGVKALLAARPSDPFP